MELLNNEFIQQRITNRNYFDLKNNNQRLGVILLVDDDPVEKLKEVFMQILAEETPMCGYHQLHNLFSGAQIINENIIINLIVETIDHKIMTIYDTIFDNNKLVASIDVGMYIQAWKSYKEFTHRMYNLIKNYQQFLVERSIKTNKISHDILSILQICMFYNKIINPNENNDILKTISDDLGEIDKKNIEQLIDYIDSIRTFMIMKDFTNINRSSLANTIKLIVNRTEIINMLCGYMHTLLISLTNKCNVIDDSEYDTVFANDFEKQTIKKIYKIATILSQYSDRTKLLLCYSKFMQTRIIDLSYNNLELEIELVRRLSGILGKDESQKLIDAIGDIIQVQNANQIIQFAEIKLTSEEYKNLVAISTKKISPIILTKSVWKIYNLSELDPNYPLEMKCYMDIISKSYKSIYQGKYIINWQPTLGSAQFEAQLGSKKVHITCNILQAMVLMYLNDNPCTTASAFSNDAFINLELVQKIFESLFEANLIINSENSNKTESIYTINRNYTGDTKIDLRKNFIEVFSVEKHIDDKQSLTTSNTNMTYNEFIKNQMDVLRKTHPNLKNTERMKIAAKEWEKYKKNNKQSAKKLSKNKDESDSSADSDSDSNSGSEESQSGSKSKSKSKSKPKSKSKSKPKSKSKSKSKPTPKIIMPINAYQTFMAEEMKNLRKLNPKKANNEIMNIAAAAWQKYKNGDIGECEEDDDSLSHSSSHSGPCSRSPSPPPKKAMAMAKGKAVAKGPAKKVAHYSSESDSSCSSEECLRKTSGPKPAGPPGPRGRKVVARAISYSSSSESSC